MLYSGAMVNALLRESNPKTQTRRTTGLDEVNKSPDLWRFGGIADGFALFHGPGPCRSIKGIQCPYGVPADRLWVRETWRVNRSYDALSPKQVGIAMGGDYAGCVDYLATPRKESFWGKTRVSIHMPRWASRITLEISSICVERLNDISAADALAEGLMRFTKDDRLFKFWPVDPFEPCLPERHPLYISWQDMPHTAQKAYAALWNAINGAGAWEANPWVWVVSFRRVDA